MKTIKQAAKEYANTKAPVVVSGAEIESTIDDLNLYAQTDFEAGAQFAQQWISVEDELPSTLNGFINKIVLIKSPNGQIVETAKYSSEKQRWLYTSMSNRHPAHWRPIERG